MESYDLTTGTFSGTSKKLFYFSIAAFVAGAAMLVAGGVMLGVGIHKYNQRVDNATVYVYPPSTTLPPSNSLSPSTGSGAPTTTTSTNTSGPITTTTTGTGGPITPTPTPTPTSTSGPITPTPTAPITTTTSMTPSTGAPDVLIMLDTSRDIGSANFDQIKDFIVTKIAPKLPLGGSATTTFERAGDKTNVGIVGFSDASVNIMSYYEISDLASVQDALLAITMTNAKTNPSKALMVMNKLGSTKVDNTNVMMVLASGTQADLDAANATFSQFQANIQNFTFVALGTAGNLDLSAFGNNENVQTFNSTDYTLSDEDTDSLVKNLNPTGAT
uniref:VWFA domain-containing protein n=1 Tax=Panagrolaimus superbus TaxID=310955 RepID=A0A914YC05_9BILA